MSAVSFRRSFDVVLKFATHDAAFDKHITSVDVDHGIIVSPLLRDHYKRQSAKEFFLSKDGRASSKPFKYLPDQTLLQKPGKAQTFFRRLTPVPP